MKKSILISGGSGLIGSRLCQLLDKDQYEIRILSRSKKQNREGVKFYQWNISKNEIDEAAFENIDHIITLAGAGIADKRWTEKRKQEIISSRVDGNALIGTMLRKLGHKPKSMVSASAIGIYGNRGEETLTENSAIGAEEFLTISTAAWEDSIKEFEPLTSRLSMIRIGIVISTLGGALEKMAMTLKFGISGYFGNGQQYYSWIHIDDICRMIIEAMKNESYSGVYNGVSPNPIRLKEMATEIKNMYLPISLAAPVPAFMLKLAMGEMTKMLTNSSKIIPERAIDAGFKFRFEDVKTAVKDLKDRKI